MHVDCVADQPRLTITAMRTSVVVCNGQGRYPGVRETCTEADLAAYIAVDGGLGQIRSPRISLALIVRGV